jgi:hypothetical protein
MPIPTDDLITTLAEAEIDGDRLSERKVVLTTATFVSLGASAPLRHRELAIGGRYRITVREFEASS